MLSLNAASTHYVVVRHFCLDTSSRACTPLLLVAGRRTRRRIRGVVSALNLDSSIGSFGSFLGIAGVGGRMCCTVCGVSGVVRRCKGKWESEGDLDAGVDLEAEILEFMRNSENPHLFPNKKQLIDAGRLDLVEAVMRQGGWLSLGWDFDSEEESMVQDDCDFRGFGSPKLEFDYGALQERTYSNQESRTLEGNGGAGFSVSSSNSSSSASSSQGSIESVFNGNIGIEGILSRLEKERNVTFGVGLREKGNGNNLVHHGQDDWPYRAQADETAARSETSSESTSLNSLGPEAWRTWSAQRVGLGNSNFEAAEIHSTANRINEDTEFIEKDILNFREGNSAPVDGTKESSTPAGELNNMNIKDRLQHLELELSSVLSSLRSKSDADKRESLESISGDLQKLSDACEFQENEIMKAKDQLRSTRARLAVLEGKMSLAITDAHKIVEEKQRRIDDAHRALQLLRTICIVWPNSASEVLLAGSFDGWTTQRKMEKSSTGIFSLCLKLYSGKYEIKFIVDGEWKVDPLRPIVHNNGYENNLLIIT